MANQEIERKFLIVMLPDVKLPPEALTGGSKYAQGYLSSKPSVRVRLADGGTEKAKAWLTIKGPGKVSRSEFEYEILPGDAEDLLALCATSLTKIRREVKVGNHIWEVDEFTGPHEGLWLAEIELDSEDEVFEMPSWVGPEVSEDPRYTNSELAKAGMPPGATVEV